jgi:hypothetical protein
LNVIAALGLSCLAGSTLAHDGSQPTPLFEARRAAESSTFPTDADVLKILIESIESEGDGIGIVVGLVTSESSRVFRYAKIRVPDPQSQQKETVFKLGSVTYVRSPEQRTRSIAHSRALTPCPSTGVNSTSRDVLTHLNGFIGAARGSTDSDDRVAAALERRHLMIYSSGNEAPIALREISGSFSCAVAFDSARGIGVTVATTSDEGAHAIAARLLPCAESHCPAANLAARADQSASKH